MWNSGRLGDFFFLVFSFFYSISEHGIGLGLEFGIINASL